MVLASLPQATGQVKNRPAIVLRAMPPYGDLLVCGVSTQLRQAVAGFDDAIGPGDPDFRASGLKAPSIIRLGFLAVLPTSGIRDSLNDSATTFVVGARQRRRLPVEIVRADRD